uniref:Prolyl 4-hydroxylase, transmembrane a n=1 Tax=Cyprinodon variegatus TaxID=28743 RepID=A0A3Q2D2K0_CYPVA
MNDAYEDLLEHEETDMSEKPFSPPCKAPSRSTRLHIQKSNVCSRAYFVVVMVFFHVYILNIIALLLYVHYNNGPADLVMGDGASPASVIHADDTLPPPAPSVGDLDGEDYSQSFSLHRLEGIRVGHVQQVSIVADRTHEMKTLSLKPLLFEIPGFLSEEESRVVVQLAQLKGLMDSQTATPSQEQAELNQPLLSLSTEEVFSLLDLNQDGFLQKQEIVSHSRSRDGTWLSPASLRQILSGLEASPTGILTLGEFRRVYDGSQHPRQPRSGNLHRHFKQRNRQTWLFQGPGSHHVVQSLRKRVISLTRLPSALVELSEPLQVSRYEHQDFTDAHYDSSSSHSETTCAHTRLAGNTSALTEVSCRYLTVLFYLNSVESGGESVFPVADNRTYDEQVGLVYVHLLA